MEFKLLECGHTAPVKHMSGSTWCPVDGEMVVVAKEKALVGAR